MTEADTFRRLADAIDDLRLWRNLVALMPYTVHHDHQAARVADRVPTQRSPRDQRRIALPSRQTGQRDPAGLTGRPAAAPRRRDAYPTRTFRG